MSTDAVARHLGGMDLAWVDGQLIGRGLGRCWLPAGNGRWRPVADRLLGTVGPAGSTAEVVQHGEYVVGTARGERRALGVVRAGEQVVAHPSGAFAVGDVGARRVASPGRSAWPLPEALAMESLRFDEAGVRVVGLDADGEPRGWHLVHRTPVELGGWPLHPDVWLTEAGVVHHRHGRPGPEGLGEASWALHGERLAGPGKRVWDLRSGEPLSPPGSVALGLTVPWGQGFVTIDWETHEGRSVCAPPFSFRLPLDADDVVTHGFVEGGWLHVGTALGTGWRVDHTGRVVALEGCPPAPAEHRPVIVDTPVGPLPMAGVATVAGRTYAWSSDGFLLDWISTPSASGNS